MIRARPNIVLFMPDQLRADAVGCFGNPVASTPNIDALASRGTVFREAFSQHSVCAPSRASIMTGWYPHTAGHRTLDHLLKPWEPNLLRILKDSGYHVAWAGARGDTFSPGVTKSSTDFAGFTVPPTHSRRPAVPPPEPFASTASFYSGRIAPRPGDTVVLDIDEATIQTAEQLIAGGMPEPWLLFVALVYPHPPFGVEEPWFSMHDRAEVPPPRIGSLDDKPRFMRAMRDGYGLARLGEEHWRELRATYYGMVSRVDHQLGRVVDAVDKAGATDRTGWAFFTDHGEYLGDYGLVEKWPSGLNDCLVHNPLILSLPGQSTVASTGQMVELVDLLPTLVELAETETAHTHFGRSLLPLIEDPSAPHRDAVFSEGGHRLDEPHVLEVVFDGTYREKAAIQQRDPVAVGKAVCVRTAAWTYTWRLGDVDELYDRSTDGDEQVNLAGRPEHAGIVTELESRLFEWLVETNDVVPFEKDPRFPAD